MQGAKKSIFGGHERGGFKVNLLSCGFRVVNSMNPSTVFPLMNTWGARLSLRRFCLLLAALGSTMAGIFVTSELLHFEAFSKCRAHCSEIVKNHDLQQFEGDWFKVNCSFEIPTTSATISLDLMSVFSLLNEICNLSSVIVSV